MEVVIKVFGTEPPCAKCRAAEKVAREVADELGGGVRVVKVSILSKEASRYGAFISPSIVINEKLAFSGRVPSKDELKRAVERAAAPQP